MTLGGRRDLSDVGQSASQLVGLHPPKPSFKSEDCTGGSTDVRNQITRHSDNEMQTRSEADDSVRRGVPLSCKAGTYRCKI